MQIRRFAQRLLGLAALALVIGCTSGSEVSVAQAEQLAARRFVAHARARGVAESPVPKPSVEVRTTDYVFVYERDPVTVTVIVEHNGEVSDTSELRGGAA